MLTTPRAEASNPMNQRASMLRPTVRPAMRLLAILLLAPYCAHAVVTRSYARCAVSHVSTVQAAQDDPLAAYSIIRDPFAPSGQEYPLVRFDGPSGSLTVLRQTSGIARFAVAAGSAAAIYLSDRDDVDASAMAVYRTLDHGATWGKVYKFAAGCPAVLAVSDNGAHVIASDSCAMPFPVVSHDFGATWQPFGFGFFSGAESYFSHADPSVVYGQAWIGMSRSTDGGATFAPVSMTNYTFDLGFQSITDWQDRNAVYTLSSGNTGVHLQVSRNGGASWSQRPSYPGWISFGIDPHRSGRIYASSQTPGEFFRSNDDGVTWAPLLAKPGVTATCNAYPPHPILASAVAPGITALVPENAFLIMLDEDAAPPSMAAVPVSIAPWTAAADAIALLFSAGLAIRRRNRGDPH